MAYTFQSPMKILAGRGSLQEMSGHILDVVRARKALIIASKTINQQGFTDQLRSQLQRSNISVDIISGVIEREPEIEDLKFILETVRASECDMLIGIGGGSVLDGVKLLSVMSTNDSSIRSMLGVNNIAKPGLSTILIPTTSGTGSEVTPNAIVTIPEDELKVGIVSKYLLPVLAILDPELTLSLPPNLTAATGIDAFTHAFESFISNKANPISDVVAKEGMRLISASLVDAYENGCNIEARESMLLGSMYGGMALTSSGTAAVHALAYPLGGKFGVPHGVANAMLLPYVTEYQVAHLSPRISKIAEVMGLHTTDSRAADAVIDKLHEWSRLLDIPQKLSEFGVKQEHVHDLAVSASNVKRLMNNNPVILTVEDIRNIYSRLL